MLKILRFLITLIMVIWLGCITTIAFQVAPSLFGNESDLVPTRQTAGDIIGPLLLRMYIIGWIAAPLVMAILLMLWKVCPIRSTKPLIVALILLASAWAIDLGSGTIIRTKIHDISAELRVEFGGTDETPKDDPRRKTFGALHGISMMLLMVSLMLGTGALFCVTQMIEPVSKEEN